jgi:hypothetical protein
LQVETFGFNTEPTNLDPQPGYEAKPDSKFAALKGQKIRQIHFGDDYIIFQTVPTQTAAKHGINGKKGKKSKSWRSRIYRYNYENSNIAEQLYLPQFKIRDEGQEEEEQGSEGEQGKDRADGSPSRSDKGEKKKKSKREKVLDVLNIFKHGYVIGKFGYKLGKLTAKELVKGAKKVVDVVHLIPGQISKLGKTAAMSPEYHVQSIFLSRTGQHCIMQNKSGSGVFYLNRKSKRI